MNIKQYSNLPWTYNSNGEFEVVIHDANGNEVGFVNSESDAKMIVKSVNLMNGYPARLICDAQIIKDKETELIMKEPLKIIDSNTNDMYLISGFNGRRKFASLEEWAKALVEENRVIILRNGGTDADTKRG